VPDAKLTVLSSSISPSSTALRCEASFDVFVDDDPDSVEAVEEVLEGTDDAALALVASEAALVRLGLCDWDFRPTSDPCRPTAFPVDVELSAATAEGVSIP